MNKIKNSWWCIFHKVPYHLLIWFCDISEPVCVESVDGYVFIKFDAKDDLPVQAVISYNKQKTQTTMTTYS